MLRLQRTRRPTLLRRLRWVAIFATVMLVWSVVEVATGDLLTAIYLAVVAVFLLVADLVTRS
jgi:hypothetical protein